MHGTALDIAGRDIANPIASIRTVALMLQHSFNRPDLAERLETAIGNVLRAGLRTADIAPANTSCIGGAAMGDAIVDALLIPN